MTRAPNHIPASRPSVLRNVAGYSIFGILAAFFLAANVVLPPQRILRLVKVILRFIFRTVGLRVRVVGSERLDPQRAYVYMGNHITFIDHLIALAYLPGYLVGLEKVETLRLPIYGRAARRWGQVHVDRSKSDGAIESCREIEKRLAAGISVALYPEGTRSRNGRLQPFKKGVFHIAVNAHATVVPISLKGLYRLIPPGRVLAAPGEVELHIGEPFVAPAPGPDAVAQLSRQVRAAMLSALGEQSLTPAATSERKS